MAAYKLAVVIKGPSGEDFLVAQQAPPESLTEAYAGYVDSDLWDLPSVPLIPIESGRCPSQVTVEDADRFADKVNLSGFDLDSALLQAFSHLGIVHAIGGKWVLWKLIEEPEFGPGPPIHTLFIIGRLDVKDASQGSCKWMSKEHASKLLLEVNPGSERLGSLAVKVLFPAPDLLRKWKVPSTLKYEEYPPGIILIPMISRTLAPFHTTNLVVVATDDVISTCEDTNCVASGDALLVDPGCCSRLHEELAELVAALPRKLLVFVTHHHYDHVDGISVIEKYNPDAVLLAHENTMKHIGNWSLSRKVIRGCEKIYVGGERFEAVFAPGHTDGHVALLHINTNSLIAGDHCVGQGSAFLDIRAGGNMKDYFQTTYKFLDCSPHVLIPMHGRMNMWPKHMLCEYLKNRRSRELSILKAIESGSETLFDILAKSYADVDAKFWLPASSNVRLHVDHLACQKKLPKEFSLEKFYESCCAFLNNRGVAT